MTRTEIYDHLAQVYLGKRNKAKEEKKKEFNVWLVINIFITVVIFASTFYGLTAFLTQNRADLKNHILYSLHSGSVRLEYNFHEDFPPTKSFSLTVPAIDVRKYGTLQFAMRGKEGGAPGIIKVVLHNQRNETASYYVQGVGAKWKDFHIPLSEFPQITDWTSLTDLSFILESWNMDKKKGTVLIDNIFFSS